MQAVIVTPPSIEPITVAELKLHLRLDSETFDGNLSVTQSLSYGSQGISALGAYTHLGTGVDVLGKQAEVLLHCGTNGATGTNDTKIQESDDNTTWADYASGAFTQITTANDNADYKLPYTGTKRYIRTVSKVLLVACEFGTSILVNAATTAEDADLADLIDGATDEVEHFTRRKLFTQTWDYHPDAFPQPPTDFITLPFGNLQSVSSVAYTDSDGTTTTLTEDTDYTVELNGDQHGRLVLPFGKLWPDATLGPSNPIAIRFICGWTTAADLPPHIKRAVKFAAEDGYYHGDRHGTLKAVIEDLLWNHRLWGEF